MLWGPSNLALAGLFLCERVASVFESAKDCLSHGMEEDFTCVRKERGKLGFMLNLNSKCIHEHWALPLLTESSLAKQ